MHIRVLFPRKYNMLMKDIYSKVHRNVRDRGGSLTKEIKHFILIIEEDLHGLELLKSKINKSETSNELQKVLLQLLQIV